MALRFTQPITEIYNMNVPREMGAWLMHGRRARLTASQPSVRRLTKKSGSLDISYSYRPVTGRFTLLFFVLRPVFYLKHNFLETELCLRLQMEPA
jgi:hypothetical protein